MTRTASDGRWLRRLAAGAVVVAGLVLPLATGAAYGRLLASVGNSTNTAASATMLYSHAYGSSACATVAGTTITDSQSVSCVKSVYPATSAGTSTPDAVTATGTVAAARVTEKAGVSSCGVVQLTNQRASNANPLLARGGTSFNSASGPMTGSGSITLDGTTGYETSVVAQNQPATTNSTYGAGIWFKAASGASGPLFGFSSTPGNSTALGTSADRILYLTATGTLRFVYNSTLSLTSAATPASYTNNAWHFAYVTLKPTGTGSVITIAVDGTTVLTDTPVFGVATYSGYWHVGWSPMTLFGNPVSYFTGSLSNFVVFNTSPAPATLAVTTATSQSTFDGLVMGATEHWKLNDTGTTTVPIGSLPTITGITGVDPCSFVDIRWGFTGPTSCAVTPQSTTAACTGASKLSVFAAAGPQTVGTVSATQTSTITLTRDTSYPTSGTTANTFVTNLMMYAPVTLTFQVGTTPWKTTFTWADSPGSTFLL